MDLTKSSNPNSIALGSAKIELTKADPQIISAGATKTWQLTELEDLGLARGIKITPSSTKIDIKADNGTVPIKGKTDTKVSVEFSLLERHLPTMAKILDGLVTLETEDGDLVNQVDNYVAGAVVKGVPVMFKKYNASGAAPTAVALKQGAATLVAETDYTLIEYAGTHFFVILADSATFDDGVALEIDYTVTPPASYTLYFHSSGVGTALGLRLTNKREADNGTTVDRVWEFPYGFFNGEDVITLKSNTDADAVAEVPIALEFSPHPDMIGDPLLVAKSLYRETQEIA